MNQPTLEMSYDGVVGMQNDNSKPAVRHISPGFMYTARTRIECGSEYLGAVSASRQAAGALVCRTVDSAGEKSMVNPNHENRPDEYRINAG